MRPGASVYSASVRFSSLKAAADVCLYLELRRDHFFFFFFALSILFFLLWLVFVEVAIPTVANWICCKNESCALICQGSLERIGRERHGQHLFCVHVKKERRTDKRIHFAAN